MDVVIEVRDARIPMSTSHPQVSYFVKFGSQLNTDDLRNHGTHCALCMLTRSHLYWTVLNV